MSDDGPLLIRPVPRRPFTLSRQSATPEDDGEPNTSVSSGHHHASNGAAPVGTTASPGLHNHLTAALAAWNKSDASPAGGSEQPSPAISRPASIMNLTSSTLYGIYSPTAGGNSARDRDDLEDSPWGMGAQTPIRRPDVDEATFELMRERSHLRHNRRRSSYKGAEMPRVPPPHMSSLQVAARTAVLFGLGLGYGALVLRLHDQEQQLPAADGLIAGTGFNSAYLGAWGVAGVVLGSLLPWFDGVWEARFGASDEEDDSAVTEGEGAGPSKVVDTGLDSALVMRAIGAFVGIVFAIRKLSWDSTLQISASLALANPLLWWLIDRSKPGFLLSAAVGLVGSLLLLGISPDMMPTPSLQILRNASAAANGTTTANDGSAATEGSLPAHNKTIETGVWMVSVLFCSCLCFGNIGRRLFLGRTAAGKGRWGGVR